MMRYVKVYSILLIVVHSVFNNLHALLMDKLLNPIWLSRSSSLLRNEIVTLYLYIKYKLQSFHLTPSAIITHYRQGNKFYTVKRCNYTRRRFGGRQPLCGTGVTSLIAVTSKPTDCSARTAASRPAPGPLTVTPIVFIPFSTAV